MEVTKLNWLQFLDEFEECLSRAEAVSIDTEFGSAIMPGHVPNILENIDLKYNHIRAVCSTFAISEVGITAILRTADSSTPTYYMKSWSIPCVPNHRVGAFHMWTTETVNIAPNIPEWRKKAIPYMNIRHIEEMRYELDKAPFKKVEPLDNIQIKGKDVKRCVNVVRSICKCEEVFVKLPHLEPWELQFIATMCPDPWVIGTRDVDMSLDIGDIVPRQVAFRNPDLMGNRNFPLFRGGIGSVMEILMNKCKNIPLITHNGILDIAYLWSHCVSPLPFRREDFSTQVHSTFSQLFDTKYNMIKYSSIDSNVMKGTDLTTCYYSALSSVEKRCRKGDTRMNIINTVREGNLHQAWWDSYMTAYIYLFFKHSPVEQFQPVFNRFHLIMCVEKWCWDNTTEFQDVHVYILEPTRKLPSPTQLKQTIYSILGDNPKPFVDITTVGIIALTWNQHVEDASKLLRPLGILHPFYRP